jgi:glycosyltransferase involved in cell wall biosynthesis
MHTTVSVIIPTYKRAHFLPQAIDSVLAQTYPHIELIVVNDGSPDRTEEVLVPYMKRIDHYIKQPNAGCAAAKNRGLSVATGTLITNLDDDDLFLPEKIERQVAMFEAHPEIGLCATGATFVDADGEPIRTFIPPRLSRRTQTLQMLRRCPVAQASVMIHRRVHDRIGNYRRILGEDYDFWLRASLDYEFGITEELLTVCRVHGDQITSEANRDALNADVRWLVEDFLTHTPAAQIIPGLKCERTGDVIIGLLLSEQQLDSLAENRFVRSPSPASDLGMGLMKFVQLEFDDAEMHLKHAFDSQNSVVASKALSLLSRARTILQQSGITNESEAVVCLRKELSALRANFIRHLLDIAIGGSER